MKNTPEEILVERISEARLSSFITASSGNVSQALALYEWNSRLSSSIFELMD